MFIDIVNLFVKAGNGGNGAATFLRGVQKARGGPDGGNGGNGGNVYFQGSASLNDLRDYRYRKIIAEDGISGKNQKRHGKNAPHLNILLPFGTQVTDLVTQEATEITDIAPVLICRGGIGVIGIGETNTELMKRHWRDEMRRISSELTRLSDARIKQIEKRKSIGLFTASIVGYTNAGKTMLFNRLTKKENYVSDTLFATLDSTVGKVILSGKRREITVSDTIGFIKNLPPGLIDAFKSTLIESANADLLLIVVDVSDPEFAHKLQVVDRILNELMLTDKKRIYLFNKIDKAGALNRMGLVKSYSPISPLFISAKTGEGIDILYNKIEQTFFKME